MTYHSRCQAINSISLEALGLLWRLIDLTQGSDISIAVVRELGQISRDRAYRLLKELIGAGLLHYEQHHNGRFGRGTYYLAAGTAMQCPESLDTDIQHTEIQRTEIPYADVIPASTRALSRAHAREVYPADDSIYSVETSFIPSSPSTLRSNLAAAADPLDRPCQVDNGTSDVREILQTEPPQGHNGVTDAVEVHDINMKTLEPSRSMKKGDEHGLPPLLRNKFLVPEATKQRAALLKSVVSMPQFREWFEGRTCDLESELVKFGEWYAGHHIHLFRMLKRWLESDRCSCKGLRGEALLDAWVEEDSSS